VIVIGSTAARVSTNQRDTPSTCPGGGFVVRNTYAQFRTRLDGRAGALVAMAGIVVVQPRRRRGAAVSD
jgi:predicted 2-oxoglutarate/Fe(II)-dependent dioxygenase YbiX